MCNKIQKMNIPILNNNNKQLHLTSTIHEKTMLRSPSILPVHVADKAALLSIFMSVHKAITQSKVNDIDCFTGIFRFSYPSIVGLFSR